MAIYIVTYDLNEETIRPNITGAIKKLGAWAKLSESSYAIDSEQTPKGVYGELSELLDEATTSTSSRSSGRTAASARSA